MKNHILVTGGTGYIGSHICVRLLEQGFKVTILDNLSNSSLSVIDKINELSKGDVNFVEGDILDKQQLASIFKENNFSAIIHLAGLKAVGESVEEPLKYFRNNVEGSANLIETALANSMPKFLFSSSATVYGQPEYLPIDESHPIQTTNPYGETKRMVELLLDQIGAANALFKFGRLRYFNPIGAHKSGKIGEDPNDIPNNLLPYVAQVASGKRSFLNIWGNDYDTADGTGVRDYIHVVDLANAHVLALDKLLSGSESFTVNLGTGKGYSVMDVIQAFEKKSSVKIPYKIAPRRPGDVGTCFANPDLAASLLGWRAEYDLDRMCEDHWRWQKLNPNGYVS